MLTLVLGSYLVSLCYLSSRKQYQSPQRLFPVWALNVSTGEPYHQMEQMTQSLNYTSAPSHQQILPHPCASAKFLSCESSTSLEDDGKYEVSVLQEISLWSAKCCNKAVAGLWGQQSTPRCVCDTPNLPWGTTGKLKAGGKLKCPGSDIPTQIIFCKTATWSYLLISSDTKKQHSDSSRI